MKQKLCCTVKPVLICVFCKTQVCIDHRQIRRDYLDKLEDEGKNLPACTIRDSNHITEDGHWMLTIRTYTAYKKALSA